MIHPERRRENKKRLIKRCPCCGSEVRLTTSGLGGVRIECSDAYYCGLMQQFFDSLDEAVEAWNRRDGEHG